MKKIMTIILTIFVGVLLVGMVSAAPSEADISNVNDLGEYVFTGSNSVDIESGNITYADIESNSSTSRWAGLLGTVTGQVVLGDTLSNVLFNWSNTVGNLVYASIASPDWSSVFDADNSDMPAYLTSGSDNYTNTFTGASENIVSVIYPSLTSDYALTFGDTWKTYSLKSGSDLIWAGKVIDGGNSYKSTTVDYQMILPEDGTAGDTSATAYNLWVELV